MAYININNPANYQLQEFGQMGFRVIDSDHLNVDGETYRTIYVVQDAVVTALTAKGDDITSKALLAGTLLHGLFSDVSVTSGKVLVYMAGRLSASEILALYNAYLIAEGAVIEGSDCVESELNSLTTDTYADASLVLIPSGYDTGVVYGERPLDSRSQLDFTRASNATRVNGAGLIEKVRTNLLLQSNQFDTTWFNSNSTETSGQSGYDGSSDAWKIDLTGAAGYISQSISVSGVSTVSLYVSAGTLNFIRFRVTGSGFDKLIDVDLTDGSIDTSGSGNIASAATSVGGGWYRISLTFDSSTSAVLIYPIQAANDFTATSGNILIQDAQLETGLVATDYIPTTTSARSTFAGITVDGTSVPNVPRLDYSGGATCPSLLLEPQRTNLITFSEYLYGISWSGQIGVSFDTNVTTSPEGLDNASLLKEDSSNGSHFAYKDFALTSGSTYTISIYAKAGGVNRNLQFGDGGVGWSSGFSVKFDLSAGTATGGTIESMGNGWYRCSVTGTANATSSRLIVYSILGTSTSYQGDGTSGVYLYGFQLEAGSYATSYIPTLGTSVTRVADSAYKTGISSLIGQTEGTIYTEVNFSKLTGTIPREWFIISNATTSATSDWVMISTSGAGTNLLRARIAESGLIKYDKQYTLPSAGIYKIAFAYKSGDCEMYINGSAVGTVVTNSAFSLSMDRVISSFSGFAFELGDGLNQAILFKTRLTNEELATLTTL